VTGGTIICEQEFVKMFVTESARAEILVSHEGAVWKQMKKIMDQINERIGI